MIGILALGLASTWLVVDASPLPQATRWVMGTSLRVVIGDPGLPDARASEILDAAFEEAQRWEAMLSNYRPETPLSAINASAGHWVDVPSDLLNYLDRAKVDARRTDGVFDLTAGATRHDPHLRAGIQFLELDTEHGRARLRHQNMALDPGGDGKGVALDAMVALLRRAGIQSALLEFGGSSWYGLGRPPEGTAWRVGLSDTQGQHRGTVLLIDQALSVSRSRSRAADEQTDIAPHIVDPRSATVIVAQRATAVLSSSATDAEVLSTALIVEGVPGFRWLSQFAGATAVVMEPGRPPALFPEDIDRVVWDSP